MATKIRFIGNIGSHNPQANNIHVGVISESTVPLLNGRLIAFAVRGTDAAGLDLAIQSQSYIQQAVTIDKTASFPETLLPEILTFAEYQSAGLAEAGVGVATGNGTRIALTAFTNDVTMLSVGFKQVAFGEILGGGVTIAEMETLLQYDVNEDGVIGAISSLKKQIEENGKPQALGFLDGLKEQADAISPYLWTAGKVVGGYVVANVASQALFKKPLIGSKGLIKL